MISAATQKKIDEHVRNTAVRLLMAQVKDECDDLKVLDIFHHDVAWAAFKEGEETFWDWYQQCGGPTNEEGIQRVLDQVGTGIDLYSAAEAMEGIRQ